MLFPPTVMSAVEQSIDLNNPDAIKQALEQRVGKRVKNKLLSGRDQESKMPEVGSHALHLSELRGMELFDATMIVEQVAAVVTRSAGEMTGGGILSEASSAATAEASSRRSTTAET